MSSTDQGFAELGLADAVLDAVAGVGYEAPSPIQAATIPPLLAGRDVVGLAQTGTGKTAAFALPILSRLDLDQQEPQALVLAPTRELALQVCRGVRAVRRAPARRARAADLRRPGVRRAAVRAAPRRPRRRRHPRPDHGPPRQGHSRPRRPPVPGARRGRRDAQHGLRRGRRDDPRRDPGRQAGRALLRHHAGPDPADLEAVPARPGRDHGRVEDRDGGQHPPALPAGLLPAEGRRPHPHPRGRELRGDDRLRPHQERDRDPGREAARARLHRRRDQRRRGADRSASGPSTS